MTGEALAPKDITQPDEGKTPVFGEVATIADERDITRGFIGQSYLYPQDRLLQAKGGDIAVYEEILSDDQVMSCLQQRRRAVVAREWEVEAGGTSRADRKAADFVREQLKALRWDAVTELAHFGVYYGYMVSELVYMRDGAQIALDAIKVRKQKRFRFGPDGRPRLRTMAQDGGEPLPPRKFWHFSTGADNSDEPYGLGLAHWLYWPVWFKKNDLKLWLQAIDKFSVPTSVGRYGPNASPADKAMLLQAGRSIRSSATVIVPKEMELAFMEAQRSGVSDNAALFDRMQGIIAKVIVGQTMTTDNGSSRSQAEVHMDVRQDIVKADADLICESFNLGPARWLTEWNFPAAAPPRVWRRVEDAPDLKAVAERDGAIARLGYKPTLAYIKETYGDGFEPAAPPALPDQAEASAPPRDIDARLANLKARRTAPEFAERPTDAADDLAQQLGTIAAPAIDGMIDLVARLVDEIAAGGGSMQDLAARLIELRPTMNAAELAALLGDAMTTANLQGRAELLDGV